MNKKRLTLFLLMLLIGGFGVFKAQSFVSSRVNQDAQEDKTKKILYFNPEVYPEVEEIKEPTNIAFFSAINDKSSIIKNSKMLRVNTPIPFDEVNPEDIKEYCKNNNADYAVVPKVKYFKVGFGKYVFSNQVVVSMKVYDEEGNLITETDYNTYKKNMRMLGSAENSVKIGTKGAIHNIIKNIRKYRKK